jgi:hypothetical protein
MTKIDWNKFPIIPDFDVLKWKAETQAEILRETEGMTNEEVREYFRKGSEEFRKEGERYRAEKMKLVPEAVALTG